MADFSLLARNFPIWRSIRAEHLLDPTTHRWELEFHSEYMQATGLTPEHVQRVLETFLVSVDEVTPDAIEIHLATTDRPSTYILGMYNRSRKEKEPKNLTPEEIADILNAVPFVMSCDGGYTADHEVTWSVTPEDIIPDLKTINPNIPGISKTTADSIRFSILKRLAAQLLDAVVTPLGLEDLKDQILSQFEKSRIHPGSMVGVTAAEALGGPITQMALNSVDATEQIITLDQKGDPSIKSFGPWIDDLIQKNAHRVIHLPENRTEYLGLTEPVHVPSTDVDGNMGWHKVSAVMRHLPVGDLIRIKTKSGRTVTATAQKSFLVYNEGKMESKNGADLKVGDRVPTILNLPNAPVEMATLDMTKYLPKTEWLYTTDLFLAHRLHKENPCKRGWWTENQGTTFTLPYERCDSAMRVKDSNTTQFREGCVYPKFANQVVSHIPDKVPLDEDFGFLVGIYLAEGGVTDTFMHISNNDDAVRGRVQAWCDKYGVTTHTVHKTDPRWAGSKGTDIKLHSVLLARWFKKWVNTGSANKVIPPEAFTAPLPFVKGLLDGYFSGDDTVNKKGYLVVTSASEQLLLGIIQLCARFSIFGKKSGHQPNSNNIGTEGIKRVHSFSIRNGFAQRFATLIGSTETSKKVKMEEHIIKRTYRDPDGKFYTPFRDVVLDPIEEIQVVPSTTQYVYDLTVPTTLRFAVFSGINCMDSFHSSGSAKNVSVGIDAIRELLNVSQKRKHERCTIYFKRQDLSFDDILVKKNEIVEVTVSSLIADYDINSPLDLGIEWWHYTYETATGRTVRSVIHKDIHQVSTVLRLYLNINSLYENRITMDQIVSAIDARNSGTVMCVASPLAIGIIDIYPNEEKIREPLQADKRQLTTTMHIPMFSLDFAPFTFLNTIVYPSMHKIWIKGTAGITRLFPSDSSIWRVVRDTIPLKEDVIESEEDPVAREQLRRIYYIVMNRPLMKASGITVDKLKQLIVAADCVVTEEDPDYLVIMLPDPAVIATADAQRWATYPPSVRLCLEVKEPPLTETDPVKREKEQRKRERDRLNKEKELRKPTGWIFSRIALDDKERKCLEKYEKDQGNLFYVRDVSPIERASKLYYAETDGSNLQALLSRDDIDDTRTICNNVHEIYRVLGIEAARTFLIREFLAVLGGDGGDINPRHVTLLVDFMTNMGEPTPITFSGISRQPIGALEKASFERAMDTFQEAAGFGKSETIKSVSAAVVIGQRAKIGTGYMDIIHDNELEQQFLKEVEALIPPPPVIPEEEREILDIEPNFATGTVQREDNPDILGEIVLGAGELTPQFEPDVNIVKEAIPAPVPKGPEVVTTLSPAVVALAQRVGGIPAFKHPVVGVGVGGVVGSEVAPAPAIIKPPPPVVPTPPRVLGPVPTLPLPTPKGVPLIKPMAKPSPIRVSITPIVAKPIAKPIAKPSPVPTPTVAIPTLKAPAPPEIKIPLKPSPTPSLPTLAPPTIAIPTLKAPAPPEIKIPLKPIAKPSPTPTPPTPTPTPTPITTPKLPPITLGAMPKVALPPLKPVAK